MADKKASDIFVSAGAPIAIKIQGNTVPVNQRVMDPAIQRMAVRNPDRCREQQERFERRAS
jgi:twitching motility protein PilU